jgi:ParB-like nuclease domain
VAHDLKPSIAHSETRTIGSLKFRRNARRHDRAQLDLIKRSMVEFGWTTPVLIDEDDVILAGYGRVEAAKDLGLTQAPVIVARGWSEAQKKAYMLADNQIALQAGWDEAILKLELDELGLMEFDLTLIGFEQRELANLQSFGQLERPVGNLRDQFVLPPFSIIDSKQGWWQERRRAWIALGIQSELGRGDNVLKYSDTIRNPDPAKRKSLASQYGEPL